MSDLVTDQARLEELCQSWRAAKYFACDTEFIRDETFDANLCLVQVCVGDTVTLIDPTADLDLAPFWELVCDPDLTTVVHAGKEDFEVCLRSCGKPPRNVFDVQIAAGFARYDYPMSLARLVDAVRRRRISKGQTMTDWSRRPLTEDQLRYAVEDVIHLLPVHARLVRRLDQLGRLDWAEEEFRRFEDPALYHPPATDRVFKLKGAKRLDAQGLAVLGRLITWRDEWAQARNRPIRSLMRDDVLVEIARRRPDRTDQLNIIRGFHQSRNGKVVAQLLDVLKEAKAIPPEEWPQPPARREDAPMTKALLDILSAVVRAICHEEGVNQNLVGSAQRLRELMDFATGRCTERPIMLRGWREHFIGQKLVRMIEGQSEIHISGWPGEPHIEIMMHEDKAEQPSASSARG